MTKDGKYLLCHVTKNHHDGGMKIEGIKPVDAEERSKIETASQAVNRFYSSQNVVRSVFANRDDIFISIREMIKSFETGSGDSEFIMEKANSNISRQFANMRSLFRSFLDHFNRYYVNVHGKESSKCNDWKNCQSAEYDLYLSYRLVYMMRNYIQHYDMPPLVINIKEQVEKSIQFGVLINMTELCEDKEIYKKLMKNNDSVAENIDLISVINEWSASFSRIAKKIFSGPCVRRT